MAKIWRILCVACLVSCQAGASVFTQTSTILGGAELPAFVTPVGGIVTDLLGQNGARLVAQVSASSLFVGDAVGPSNMLTIGQQFGYTDGLLDQLGPLAEVAFRFSVFDGDTARGNFDYQRNMLLVNGIDFGNWSAVQTESTTSLGQRTPSGLSSGGFRDERLDTGFFYSNDRSKLAALYASLRLSSSLTFAIQDSTPRDQYYDFREAIDPSLVSAGSLPVIVSYPTPEPSTDQMIALSAPLILCYGFRTKTYTRPRS